MATRELERRKVPSVLDDLGAYPDLFVFFARPAWISPQPSRLSEDTVCRAPVLVWAVHVMLGGAM